MTTGQISPVEAHGIPRSVNLRRFGTQFTWYLVLSVISLAFISPVVVVLLNSFKSPTVAIASPPVYLTTHPSLENYTRLWTSGLGIEQSLVNSAVVAVASVLLTVSVALLAAYGFQRYAFRGSQAIFVLMLAPIMIPFQVLLTPLFIVLFHLHLTNTLVGLVLVNTTYQLPFSMFVIRVSFATIPRELYEAAAVDGANAWKTLRMVLPLVRPGIITGALFAFLAAWNEFFAAIILLADQSKFTLPVILTTLVNGARGSIDWGLLQSGVVVTIIPCLVIFIALQRHYVRGLITASGK